MALEWKWKDKIGEATLVQMHPDEPDREFTINLYQGNAYLIMIHEYKDEDGNDMYNLFSFFMDCTHMKNCLGLGKKGSAGENIFDTPYQKITKIRLNKKKYKHTVTVAQAFIEAFRSIQIETYSEEDAE